MIDVKQAILKAKEFAQDILGQEDLLLEEVSSDADSFSITLSMPRRAGTRVNTLDEVARVTLNPFVRNHASDREFKEFHILKSDGSVTRMKIREIA